MSIITGTYQFEQLSSTPNLRLWMPFVHSNTKYPLCKIMDYISVIETGNRPKGGITNIDEGAISLGGEQIDPSGCLDLSSIPLVPFEFYENANKGKVQKGDILVCKDGALTGKVCLVENDLPMQEVMINEHVFLIRANRKCEQLFLFYLIQSSLVQRQIKDLAYKKKGQPGLNTEHLQRIKVPDINLDKQKDILRSVAPLIEEKKRIEELLKNTQKMMSIVFSGKFNIDLDKIAKFERKTNLIIKQDYCYRNPLLRFSYRWHKLQQIQDMLYKGNHYIAKLGRYLKSTRNGWSPNCRESDTLYPVFALNSLSKDTIMKSTGLKFTNEKRNNIDEFIAKEGDFFVSRGNTVDLVALASIVDYSILDDTNIIFPDLFIKMEFDKAAINPRYLAYLFNSIIGRLYFKYSAKGKNQTMVKISSHELNNFYLPIPDIKLQIKIVDEIKESVEQQSELSESLMEQNKRIRNEFILSIS